MHKSSVLIVEESESTDWMKNRQYPYSYPSRENHEQHFGICLSESWAFMCMLFFWKMESKLTLNFTQIAIRAGAIAWLLKKSSRKSFRKTDKDVWKTIKDCKITWWTKKLALPKQKKTKRLIGTFLPINQVSLTFFFQFCPTCLFIISYEQK